MLSYQHGFHAGNLADVHKHAMLARLLAYMTAKDKPLCYIETHAGRGVYDLVSEAARKTGEAAQGIRRIEPLGWFAPDHPYATCLSRLRDGYGPDAYPGSPMVAALTLRPGDTIHLAELHPQEFTALEDAMNGFPARLHHADGFQVAQSLTPPTPRRGVMMIDPSFEVKSDYAALPGFLKTMHRKWNVGVLVLWYPILTSGAHLPMLAEIEAAGFAEPTHHEVRFAPARAGHGMVGSGLFVVNTPWGLADEAKRLSGLFETLG